MHECIVVVVEIRFSFGKEFNYEVVLYILQFKSLGSVRCFMFAFIYQKYSKIVLATLLQLNITCLL